MEKKLSRMFDFQKFAANSELASIIDEVEGRYPECGVTALSDDDLSFIAAAGQPDFGYSGPPNKKDEREK